MMKSHYRAKPTEIQAIEWTGENLREVQHFMYPDSPLFGMTSGIGSKQIGVHVYTGQQYTPTSLVFAQVGQLIVKIPNGFVIQTREQFDQLYEEFYPGQAAPPPVKTDEDRIRFALEQFPRERGGQHGAQAISEEETQPAGHDAQEPSSGEESDRETERAADGAGETDDSARISAPARPVDDDDRPAA